MYEILKNSPLFSGLTDNQVEGLFEKVVYQVHSYAKGDVIASAGDECKSLYMVIKGNVKGEMIDFSGRVLKIEDITPPRPLAVAFLFGKSNHFPVTVSATKYSELLVFPKKSVVAMMQQSEYFLTNFLNSVSNRAQFISGKLRFLSFKTLKGKLGHFLMEQDQLQKQDGNIVLNKTQEELAELFGVARPSLSRTLRELHNQEIIFARGRNIQILDKNALFSEIDE